MAEKQNENSKARHLKIHQWKKGESGNLRGRPRREACLTDALRVCVRQRTRLANGTMVTQGRALAARIWDVALAGGDGCLAAAKIIFDRLEGRVQEIELPEDPRRIIVTPMPEPGCPPAPPAEDDDECPV